MGGLLIKRHLAMTSTRCVLLHAATPFHCRQAHLLLPGCRYCSGLLNTRSVTSSIIFGVETNHRFSCLAGMPITKEALHLEMLQTGSGGIDARHSQCLETLKKHKIKIIRRNILTFFSLADEYKTQFIKTQDTAR